MSWRVMFVVIYLAALTLYTHELRKQPEPVREDVSLADLPLTVGGYVGEEAPLDDRSLGVLGADIASYRHYKLGDGRPLSLFLGHFGTQQERSQIHSPKHCYPGAGWTIYDERAVTIAADARVEARRLLMQNGPRRQVVLYWFYTDSGVITNEFALKWHQMKNALLKQSQRATFVRFSAPLAPGDDVEAVVNELGGFIGDIAPHIRRSLKYKETNA